MSTAIEPAAGDVILRTEGLTRRFGSILAVDDLDLDVRTGEVHGFLGPNGSGKSTTVGMVLGLIRPTSGRVEIFGKDASAGGPDLLKRVGAIIESPAFYPFLSGRDNLRAIGMASGGVPESRIDELLAMVGLSERSGSQYKTYSLGMKQRLGIASTLLNDPALVILDEPTNGLDPAGQREVRDMIPRLAHEGRGVLLASHMLHEVQQVCDRVTIIRRGRLVESGSVHELMRRGSYLQISIEQPGEAAEVLRALPFVEEVAVDGTSLAVHAPLERAAEVNRALAQKGMYAGTIVPHLSTLEDVFLELTGESPEAGASE